MHGRIKKSILTVISFILTLFLIFTLNSCTKNGKDKELTLPTPKPEVADTPVIIIDAGHGGEDGGTSGKDGTLEKDLNLAIALELCELFRASGYEVRLTRESDMLLYDRDSDYQGHKKAQDMAARLAIMNEYTDAVFISIHMNSFPQSKYHGLQVYYSPNSPESQRLANTVQSTVASNLQPENDRKTKSSDGNIYLLDKTDLPAILIECGFLSNPEECALLATDAYRARLALCIYTATVDWMKS